MRPPHSGQTQFRMSDITSEPGRSMPHLVICIRSSPISKISADRYPPWSCIFGRWRKAERKSWMHFQFQHCVETSEVASITRGGPRCRSRHPSKYCNVPSATVAFAVPPPLDPSFRCEGGLVHCGYGRRRDSVKIARTDVSPQQDPPRFGCREHLSRFG
jgi:hypothetical protein